MSRPLRIEYPDAWYHVLNRGRRSENVFLNKKDYKSFLELLIESTELWNVRIAAYCLMPNHYHLLLQTPDANLSRCMRHINGIYTQRFNRLHQCDGQLFRGRFKSILIDVDSYLLQLVRYIHKNPLQGGLVDRLDAYGWSSHKAYISNAKKWDWLYKEFVLSMLSDDKKHHRQAYREFLAEDDFTEINKIFEGEKFPSVLGSERFINRIRDKFFDQKSHEEVPESRLLAPSRERIKRVVCETYRVDEEVLLKSKRGTFNEPRNVAIYLCRRLRADRLDEICQEFGMKRYSTASSVLERVKVHQSRDRRFQKRVEELRLILTKSQT